MNNQELTAVFDSRRPSKDFRRYFENYGEEAIFLAIDGYLGDLPDNAKIRKVAAAVDATDAELRRYSDAPNDETRRVARLILHEKSGSIDGDITLQKGLSDASAGIRCDAARFCSTDDDRTRLYNQLIRLIREDPDGRVRRSAGQRLASSFADLYSVDFQGLPPLSQMLILDALEGVSRSDEERAVSLLDSQSHEAAYRAARCLLKWGTLRRFFTAAGADSSKILERCAQMGVVDYLDSINLPNNRTDQAIHLAGIAGRDDIVRKLTGAKAPAIESGPDSTIDIELVESLVNGINAKREMPSGDLSGLPLKEEAFKKAVTAAYPPPDRDSGASVLFDMARQGLWRDWSDRCADALDAPDPDLRRSAASALSVLDPELAAEKTPSLLTDAVPRVRKTAARALVSLASGEGGPPIAEYLRYADEGDAEAVLEGVKHAGSVALARCIVDNAEVLGSGGIGVLLKDGIDPIGVELISDGFSGVRELSAAMKKAGPKAGAAMLAAWKSVESSSRRKLLSWIGSSGWAESLNEYLSKHTGSRMKEVAALVKALDEDERRELFKGVLESADGSMRRRFKRLIRG